jgi:acetolactate synthase I/II/III large subunit
MTSSTPETEAQHNFEEFTTEEAIEEPISGAHILLRSMIAEGVDTVFGYPGGVILPIYEALPDYPELKHILVRHEQGATHMAEGYARATGKAGVVLVTSGPGATNIVTGVADAYYDSTPMVVFTGNVPQSFLGNDAFQEADILGITRPCTKHNIIVRDIEDLAGAVKEAFHVATTGRPGPVVVDIPKDIINALTYFDYELVELDIPGYSTEPDSFSDTDLKDMLSLLASAKRPIILAGGGVVNGDANTELLAFAERFQIPVGNSLMGLGGFPLDHALALGFTGMHGHYWANIAIAKADVLFIFGNRLNERQTGKADRFARNAKIVHVDMDPSSLQKNVGAFLPIQGRLKAVLPQALAMADTLGEDFFAETMASRSHWLHEIDAMRQRRTDNKVDESLAPYLTPGYAIERLFEHLPKDSFVTTEVGQHQMWAAQRYNLSRPRSFITSGGLGTMGFGFPAAIGVQAAFPKATVMDIAGDGSFQMTLQELATAQQYNLPVKVAIINNAHLGMIRQWQGSMYGRESEAAMWSPDYLKLAEAYSCAAFQARTPEELEAILPLALAITDRPVLIDIIVSEKSDVYPWVQAGCGNDEMLEHPRLPEQIG